MMKNKKLQFGVISVIIIVIILIAFFATQKQENNETIKIAVMAPFSGQTAWWGEYIRQGVELALKDLPESERLRIEIVWEDDQCSAMGGVTSAEKIVFADKANFIIGPLCNESTIPTKSLFENNKIISLTTGLPNAEIAGFGKYSFSFLPEIKELMKALADYSFYKKNNRKIAILYINGSYGFENYSQFKQLFESIGGKVVAAEAFDIGSNDLKTQVAKIKSANPDGLLIVDYGPSLITALKQIEEAGISGIDKYGINSFESPEIIQQVPLLSEGVVYPAAEQNTKSEEMESFAARYKAAFGKESNVYSANAFDSFNILHSAIKKCGQDSECVSESISRIKEYPGANGVFSVDERGAGSYKSILLKTVKNEEFVRVE